MLRLIFAKSNNQPGALIDEFLSVRSPSTAKVYRSILDRFVLFIGGPDEILTTKSAIVAQYVADLAKRPGCVSRPRSKPGVSDATIRLHLTAIRGFYKFLQDEGVVSRNVVPASLIRRYCKGLQKRPTNAIPFDQVNNLISAFSPEKSKSDVRNTALLSLLFATGFRLEEIRTLEIGQIVFNSSIAAIIDVRCKGNQARQKVLANWTLAALKALLAQRAQDGAGATDPLFAWYRGRRQNYKCVNEPIGRAKMRRIFQEALELCGLDTSLYSIHSARATAISKLLSDGLSYREVQEFSGHASISMVQVYDKRRIDDPAYILKY